VIVIAMSLLQHKHFLSCYIQKTICVTYYASLFIVGGENAGESKYTERHIA